MGDIGFRASLLIQSCPPRILDARIRMLAASAPRLGTRTYLRVSARRLHNVVREMYIHRHRCDKQLVT
jgi:hypothetical protein